MSIILIGLYLYFGVKAYLIYTKRFEFIRSGKYEFVEILILSILFGFAFNLVYPTDLKEQNFIVSRSILWIAFISSLLMLGVGVGVRFVSEILKSFLEGESLVSEKIRLIHDFYSQVWITINLGFLAFLLCIIELSKSTVDKLNQVEIVALYIFSVLFGGLFAIINKSKKDMHKVVIPLFLLFGICIFMLTLENSTYYSFRAFPITNSFLIFSISFLIITLYSVILPKSSINIRTLNFSINKKIDTKSPEISELTLEKELIKSNSKTLPLEDKIVTYKPEKTNLIKVSSADNIKTDSTIEVKSTAKKLNKQKKQKGPAVLSLSSLKS